ncbi:pilin N-terminal domain-containing protein [Enterococcus durans]|nr:pilin N-terminal domain-containing protein [Enterococcus durans]MDT2836799.1 pilin N-terminal domain-containing protein [Enterococcus durans]
MDNYQTCRQNGGVLSPEDLPSYRGLNGVTFSLYDVTDHYYSYGKKV